MTRLIDKLYEAFDNNKEVIVMLGCGFYSTEYSSIIDTITYNDWEINVSFSNELQSSTMGFNLCKNSTYTVEEDEEFGSETYYITKDGSDGYLNLTFI